ncbi:hypothetical protein TRIUR3_33841 [Triticum urartu]|uniref:DUF6598 domain-containing protein n=1 Tax=Triticum urartu TaxID=4572 RepID=M8A127_TRIUA|nr:hypothetical protein TRIUR3_33841 [Triticum urartu]
MEPVRSGDGSGELIGIGSGKRKGVGSGKRKGIVSGKRTGISSETLKLLLAEALKTRAKNQISSRLRNIDDQGQRIQALREFQAWIMHQHPQSSIDAPMQTEKSEGIEDLGKLVDTLAGEISSSMVVEFALREKEKKVEQEEKLVCALDSCSEEIRDLWENFPRYEHDLALLSKVQSISASIDMLRRLEPELDIKLRSMEVKTEEEEISRDDLDCKLGSMELKVDEEELSKDEEAKSESIAAGMVVEGLQAYRSCWESLWRPARSFEDMTLASSMLFTHCTPGRMPRNAIVGSTLQIYSIKVAEIHGFESPLKVYGVVAARDTVDSSRNPIFLRPRNGCQILNLQEPFLHLTGPCRAIVSMNPVDIEIELKLKGATKSEDRILISKVYHYNGESNLSSPFRPQSRVFGLLKGTQRLFRMVAELRASRYLTSNPKKLCCLTQKVEMPMGKHRCFELSRKVVSVELEGKLKVMIQAYAPSGEITGGHVLFTPQKCGATKGICHLGETAVERTPQKSQIRKIPANIRAFLREWSEEPEEIEVVAVKQEPEEIGSRDVIRPEDFAADVDAIAAAIAERSLHEEAERWRHHEELEDLVFQQAVAANLAAKEKDDE